MANELTFRGDPQVDSGNTIHADVEDALGNLIAGPVPLTENGTTAIFSANMPATVPAGVYFARYYNTSTGQLVGHDTNISWSIPVKVTTIVLSNGTIYSFTDEELERCVNSLNFGSSLGYTTTPGNVDNVTYFDVANPTRPRVRANIIDGNRTITWMDGSP